MLAKSIEDIFKKNVSVCTGVTKWILKQMTDNASEDIRKFVNLTTNKAYCSSKYPINEVQICNEIDCYINQYAASNEYEKKIFEVLDFNLPMYLSATFFAPYSPFKKKYAEMYSKLHEFGFDKKLSFDLKIMNCMDNKKNSEFNPDDKILLLVLMLLIVIGVGLAVIAFLLELIWKSSAKIRNKIFCSSTSILFFKIMMQHFLKNYL